MDGVNQLLVKLPQAKSVTEIFSMVAAGAHDMFQGLQHISVLLLPQQHPPNSMATCTAAGTSTSGPQQAAAATKGSSKAGSSSSAGTKNNNAAKQQSSVDLQSTELQQPFKGGHGLDWSNCCVFRLFPNRGAVVQPPASWPVTCMASCHAAVTARETVTTADYAAQGPHFLDWKCLAERGCKSMAAVPMFSCNRPVAVLCLASDQADAFSDRPTLELLGGALAPYCNKLEFTTRRADMQRLVNEIITPIAAQLAQQKHSRLEQLGCTVEEAPPGTTPADGKGISVAVGGQSRSSKCAPAGRSSKSAAAATSAPGLSRRKGSKAAASVDAGSHKSSANGNGQVAGQVANTAGGGSITHKRFESVIVKSQPYSTDSLSTSPDLDLDWSDFFFNLVSMAIVYVYFSKAAVAGESLIAILLCMGVAAFDIVLLAMRWLWFEQYLNYGGIVLSVFQAYRAVVLPLANTWMSWSLLNKMSATPSWPVITLLGVLLVACIVMGLQVRFFLHAPLQLASVLFAATSTPDICGALMDNTSSLRCIGVVSAVQLTLGLVLPSLLVYCLEGRPGRAFLPHMQAKRLHFTRQ